MVWTQLAFGSFERWRRTYVRWRIGIAKITTTSWPTPCTAVLCPWRKRLPLLRKMGTVWLLESEQTSKPSSKCCALAKVAQRILRSRKHRRLADRVHGHDQTTISSVGCRYSTYYECSLTLDGRLLFSSIYLIGDIRHYDFSKIIMNNCLPHSVLCLKLFTN